MSTATADVRRDLGSILSRGEKSLLVWLAERTPRAVNSDHLTLLGLLGVLGAGLSFWAARIEPVALFGVAFFLAVNWLGDSLDGTLARVRNSQRPKYGYYVDHVVDVFGSGLPAFRARALGLHEPPRLGLARRRLLDGGLRDLPRGLRGGNVFDLPGEPRRA